MKSRHRSKISSKGELYKAAKHHHIRSIHNKPKKSWFYKILLPFLVLSACLVFYFLVIVSSAPRSFEFITKKIQKELNNKFDNKASIKDSFLSFTRYGTMKIAITGLRISYQKAVLDNFSQKTEDKYLMIPKIEVEFSLINLLLIRFQPSKIKIISPQILIGNISHLFSNSSSQQETKLLPDYSKNQLSSPINKPTDKPKNEIVTAKKLNIEPQFSAGYQELGIESQKTFQGSGNNQISQLTTNLGQTLDHQTFTSQNLQQDSDELSTILSFLQQVQEGSYPTENFEIENAKLLFRRDLASLDNSKDCMEKNCNQEFSEILIKKSTLKLTHKQGNLHFISKSAIAFDKNSETNLESNCQLSTQNELKCSLQISNFVPNHLATLDKRLSELKNFNGSLSGNFEIFVENETLKNISFKLRADVGNFIAQDFFIDKIEFKNFTIDGNYDHRSKMLNVSKADVDLVSKITNQTEIGNPHLSASATYSNSGGNHRLNLLLNLHKVLNQEVYRFWPLPLNQNEIRDWYLEHLRGGLIKSGYARIAMSGQDLRSMHLDDINAQSSFTGISLEYDKNFPKISNLSGIADFTKNSMKIDLHSGDVLQSKISSASVAIEDFFATRLELKIAGESNGNPADGLKHASSDSSFANMVEKYLNGYAQNKFFISLPLTKSSTQANNKLNLADCHLRIESAISGLKNDFAKGDLLVKVEKKPAANKFETEIDLTGLSLDIAELGVIKNIKDSASLKLIVDFGDQKQLGIKQINLTRNVNSGSNSTETNQSKTNKILAKNTKKTAQIIEEKILGDLQIDLTSGMINRLSLTNKGFGKNDYNLLLERPDEKITKLKISGNFLSAASLIKSKLLKELLNQENQSQASNQKIRISLARLELMNKKSLTNVLVNLNCQNGSCNSGQIQAKYLKNRLAQLNVLKEKNKPDMLIEGFINDSGFIAEALDLSKLASGGNLKFKIKQTSDTQNQQPSKKTKAIVNSEKKSKRFRYDGELTLESPLTIFENESVKKLSKNTLFSKIKDQIFASEKTIFNSGKIDLSIIGDELIINSMIANNFKIGVTARGKINLKNDEILVSGMIIPGYIVNSLFGISKIPIIGSVVSGLLTGGEEGGGVFGLRYEYSKKAGEKEGIFTTNKVAAFVPTTIQNLFN